MAAFKAEEVIINLKLMKICGFYYMFCPNASIMFNWTFYQLLFFVIIVMVQCLVVFGILGSFIQITKTFNIIDTFLYIINCIHNYLSLLKISIFLYNANRIWKLLDVTRLNFFTSKRCRGNIQLLYKCRVNTIKMTNLFFIYFNFLNIQWFIYPLVTNTYTMTDNTSQRSQNILNLFQFPIAIQTYNHYYIIFYLMESTITIFISYVLFNIDMFLLSLCSIIKTEYDILSRAFANIGYVHESQTGKIFLKLLNF